MMSLKFVLTKENLRIGEVGQKWLFLRDLLRGEELTDVIINPLWFDNDKNSGFTYTYASGMISSLLTYTHEGSPIFGVGDLNSLYTTVGFLVDNIYAFNPGNPVSIMNTSKFTEYQLQMVTTGVQTILPQYSFVDNVYSGIWGDGFSIALNLAFNECAWRSFVSNGSSTTAFAPGTFSEPGLRFKNGDAPGAADLKTGIGVETNSKTMVFFAEDAGAAAAYIAGVTMNVGFPGQGHKQTLIAPNSSAGVYPAIAFWHNAPVPGSQVTGIDSPAYTQIDACIESVKVVSFIKSQGLVLNLKDSSSANAYPAAITANGQITTLTINAALAAGTTGTITLTNSAIPGTSSTVLVQVASYLGAGSRVLPIAAKATAASTAVIEVANVGAVDCTNLVLKVIVL